MTNFSVDGLASGLDTTSIIKSLMDVERQPLVNLTRRQSSYQAKISAWSAIDAAYDALDSAVDALRQATSLDVFTATSTRADLVTATATSGGTAGSFTFSVEALAAAHQMTSEGFATSDVLVGAGTLTISNAAGESVDIVTDATTTLAGLVGKINSAGGPAHAQLIDVGSGATPFQLIVTASSPGTDSSLTVDVSGLSGFTQPLSDLRVAADAVVNIGALSITRSSNTITDIVPGVSLDLVGAAPGTDVTVTLSRDSASLAERGQAFVDAINGVLSAIDKYSDYDVEAQKGGALVGDSRARGLKSSLFTALGYANGHGTYGYLGAVGISVGRDGRYTFNGAKFTDALADDADAVADLFSGDAGDGVLGVMGALHDVVATAADSGGLIDGAKDSAESVISTIKDQIADQEDRLVAVELRYRRQFTALETTLGQLANQSTWLSGIIGSLSPPSS